MRQENTTQNALEIVRDSKFPVANSEKNIYNETMDKINDKALGQEQIRINKYLSDAGFCSRREADRLAEAGRITVDGHMAKAGDKVVPGSVVCVDGVQVNRIDEKVLLLFYKPRGIVCSTKQQRDEITVTDYLKYPLRIYPVGRLDKESEGLLLLTNEGGLVNKIMRAGNHHEKEYLVTVDKAVDDSFIRGMSGGVPILDTVTRPCFIERTGKHTFRVILTQGLNRQIRRMCEYFGYHVVSLKRVRIMNLKLSGLKPGEYREIADEEWKELSRLVSSSSNETVTAKTQKTTAKTSSKAVAKAASETVIETGGHHGDNRDHTANEGAGRKARQGSKSLLSAGQGNHDQSGVRRSVRRAAGSGGGNGHRSGKQPHGKRRL